MGKAAAGSVALIVFDDVASRLRTLFSSVLLEGYGPGRLSPGWSLPRARPSIVASCRHGCWSWHQGRGRCCST
jgi:hypothetical protein